MLRKLLTLTVLCFVAVSYGFAQTGSISGTVTDSNSGETLPSANIYIPELERGASTDVNGEYEIANVPAGTYTLRATYIGYTDNSQQVTVTAGEETVMDFAMAIGSAALDEVIVTGYGDVTQRKFTGSTSTVSAENINDVPVSDPTQALQGKVAGAVITSSTGTPGAEQQIRIRGISSINAGVSPLFVIDGVPVVSGDNATSGATSSFGILNTISPSDIESVTVLKDAVSTAPYGARGANGVVVINTKSGRSGDVTYSLEMQRGVNNRAVDGPGAMTAEEWDQQYYDAAKNLLIDNGFSDPTRTQVDQLIGASGWDGQTYTDWGDVVTNENAVQQSYNLSARGGNERTTFYASGSFFDQEGPVLGTGLDRISGKFNIDHQLDETISITNNFTGSYVKQDGILEGAGYFGSPVLAEFFMPPIDRAYNDDGSANTNLGAAIFNPVYIQNNDISRKRNYRLLNNTTLDAQLLDNLSFTTNFAIDYLITEEKYYRNPFYGDAAPPTNGSVNDINNRNFNYVWRNTLQYIWTLNADNILDFRAVSESQRNYHKYLDAYGTGIAADGLVNLNTTASPQFVGSSTSDWAVQSFTGLANYSFRDKLYADASIRYEGNSRFAPDVRWGTFWAVGLGYVLTEDDYLQDADWLNFLKVRASYGKTGNASIGLNQYQATVGFNNYNDQASIQPNQLGNNSLTWEEAYSLDLGLEFEMFNRLDGSVTWFRKDGTDLLFAVPLSLTTGHSSQTQNLGELYNQGIEVELNVNVIQNQNFAWNLGGNFTKLENEVTDLPLDPNGNPRELTSGTKYIAVEGYEVGAWFMREWAGVDPENGNPLWYMDDGNGGRTTTSNYNAADSYYQGASAQPTTFGGLNTRVDIANFYVSADLYYAFGHKVFDNWAFYMRSDGAYAGAFGQYASQAEYWEEEGDQAENPRPVLGGNNQSSSTSSRFLYDGDYLRLKTLNVGYNIPASFLENVGLKSATIYFLGQNLWTHAFDEDLEYDPEVQASGFTSLQAAPLKSLTFGIKANF